MSAAVCRSLLAAAVLTLVTGCSTLFERQFLGPTGPDSATLAITNGTAVPVKAATYLVPEDCRERYMFNPPLPPAVTRTVSIPTDRVFAFTLLVDMNLTYCHSSAAFQPEAGHRYGLKVSTLANLCLMNLTELGQAADGTPTERRLPLEKRETVTPWDERGPFCKARP